jgi:uncharacterized membrane protein SirB2
VDASLLKFSHVTCVAISYSLFFLRGVWMLRDSTLLQRRWVKIVPHVVDTLLLLSAISLAWVLGISPLAAPWLAAKIVALLLYIVAGMVALKYGSTKRVRLAAWLSGQMVFVYIVCVALTHNPEPWQNL